MRLWHPGRCGLHNFLDPARAAEHPCSVCAEAVRRTLNDPKWGRFVEASAYVRKHPHGANPAAKRAMAGSFRSHMGRKKAIAREAAVVAADLTSLPKRS